MSAEASRDSRAPATYQDILNAPENILAQIINGVFYASPWPSPRHQLTNTVLSSLVMNRFDPRKKDPRSWWIFSKPQLKLGEDYLVPDIVGWRRERMPQIPNVVNMTLTPDWVCEILSPSTHHIDLSLKPPIYAREGVPHMWQVDPLERTLEAFELRNGEWESIAALKEDGPLCVPPFEAVTFQLSDLWLGTFDVNEPEAKTY